MGTVQAVVLRRQPFVPIYGHCPTLSPLGVSGKTKNFTAELLVYLFVQFMALQLTGIAF